MSDDHRDASSTFVWSLQTISKRDTYSFGVFSCECTHENLSSSAEMFRGTHEHELSNLYFIIAVAL